MDLQKKLDDKLSNSIIIINKPPGQSSHEITTFVKKITGVSRSGHAGTLDPEVSGVLPVALGRATKLIQYIAGKEKTYVGIIKFKKKISKIEVEKLFKEFTGTITQTPPKISAVKKVARKRTIYSLKLIEADEQKKLFLFEARVDAGTYIRTLCEDIGEKCGGAYMEELRRIAVGKIGEKQTHTMQQLIDAMYFYKNKNDSAMLESMLVKPEDLIDLPKVYIKETALKSVLTGAQIMMPAIEKLEGFVGIDEKVAIYCGDKFYGVGISKIRTKDYKEKEGGHGLAIKLERVHKPD
ncbi:RNA-guided pseudouridylation complex pseudouridine synthase subunit Cbf5 [Candidatus Micrarchaeota archaeon]|nr:RNA-guided pseudouridylation complex pseudouridine synthase subunit Cbf5 [Candidatus Micrarchaeota archaeon]